MTIIQNLAMCNFQIDRKYPHTCIFVPEKNEGYAAMHCHLQSLIGQDELLSANKLLENLAKNVTEKEDSIHKFQKRPGLRSTTIRKGVKKPAGHPGQCKFRCEICRGPACMVSYGTRKAVYPTADKTNANASCHCTQETRKFLHGRWPASYLRKTMRRAEREDADQE